MRLAVITETFTPFLGGSAKRYLEVCKRIAEKGHQVDLFTVRFSPDWPKEERIQGINVYRIAPPLRGFITGDGFRSIIDVFHFSIKALKELVKKSRYDVIEANHCPIFPAMSSWLTSKAKRIPLSITYHEAWYNHWYYHVPHRIYAPMGIILEKITTKLPDIAIAVSNIVADRLKRYFHVDRKKIRIISNGVDWDLINRIQTERMEQKIIYIGRLSSHKKIDWLLKAYQGIEKKYPNASLEIIGDGPNREGIQRKIKRMRKARLRTGLNDLEVIRALKSSSVYVLPSIREGQSITTIEAMSAGTPQIVVDIEGSGAAELIKNSESGIVVNPSPRAISEAIERLFETPEEWRRFQLSSLRFARNFSWDKTAKQYLETYKKLLHP